VALPLSCTQPIDFGGVSIGSTATVSITCTAQIPINKVTGCTTQDKTFQCLNSSLPVGPLAKGASFTFPVVWNLTQSSINDAQNVSFGHVLPGVQSTVLDLYTQNGVTGYSTDLPLSIGGTTISQTPFLAISPQEVDFGGIVVGSPTAESGLSGAVIISNLGSQVLVFTGFAWDDGTESDVYYNLTTASDGSSIVGYGFTAASFPNVGDTIAAGSSITIPLKFKINNVGSYSSILTIWSNGGSQYVLLAGSASTNPVANISVSTIEGGWDYEVPVLMDFGNVLAGTTVVENIRLCNSGGSAMTVTKSKPPTQPELTASNPTVDLHEGQSIPINACALGPVKIIAAFQGPNRPAHVVSDVWTLNCDGLNSDGSDFGVHDVAITATITTNQVGVLLPNGTARYQYLGCYADGSGRQLATKLSYNNSQQAANENGQCQRDCFSKGYIFAGTEYREFLLFFFHSISVLLLRNLDSEDMERVLM
jgi:iron transport multicopper oxidase